MIVRDSHGIIVQHDKEDILKTDGGDSSARMGISGLENDGDCRLQLEFLDKEGRLCRHPFEAEWDDPELTSRDQVIQFCASDSLAALRCARYYCTKSKINKDILSPSHRLYLYKKANWQPPTWIRILGTANLWLDLAWNTKIKPFEEMNQFACMVINLGDEWKNRFVTWHPDIKKSILEYWTGWRDQKELGLILLRSLGLNTDDL